MKVTITTLGRFHAFDLAQQLEKAGHLERLISVYPKYYVMRWGIPRHKIVSLLWIGAFGRLFLHWRGSLRDRLQPLQHWLFDVFASFFVPKKSDIVVGWSSCCEHILKKAKKYGAVTIVERGSAHIEIQDQLLREEAAHCHMKGYIHAPIHSVIEKEKREYTLADYISTPSGFTLKSFLDKGFSPEKLLVNPYGANLTQFYPEPKMDDVFRIVHCGAITFRKGVHYLLRAFHELALPNSELWLIGRVSDEMLPYLKKYQASTIICKGTFPQNELVHLYSQGSCFCLCSLEEGMAMVILQAMACGLPLVATINTGGGDVISDNDTGILLPIRDVEALKKAIRYLYDHPEKRHRMGENALHKVQHGFSWEDYGRRSIENYQACLQKKALMTDL